MILSTQEWLEVVSVRVLDLGHLLVPVVAVWPHNLMLSAGLLF